MYRYVTSAPLIFLGLVSLCSCAVYQPGGAPVYVNPDAIVDESAVQPTAAISPDFQTQTVYGFLDFTTTIGNTVMVFSPQSSPAAAPEPVKPSAVPVVNQPPQEEVNVIETKPLATVVTSVEEIQPSKIVKQANKPLSSVVHVVAANSPTVEPVKSVKPLSAPKVQVISSFSGLEKGHSKDQAPIKVIASQVQVVEEENRPAAIIASHVEVQEVEESTVVVPEGPKVSPIYSYSSIVEVQSSEDAEPVLQVENNINDPEYEFLSRQPSEFAEETYRLHNIKSPNSKFVQKSKSVSENAAPAKKASQRPHKADDTHPTGLVTKLGGTVVKDGATTVHETSVIGTYISGKYAQVLQSTSHIFHNNKPKIAPTPSLRILKTAAPSIPKKQTVIAESSSSKQAPTAADVDDIHVEEIYGNTAKQNLVRASRRPAVSSNSFKNRFRQNRPSPKDDLEYQDIAAVQSEPTTSASVPNYKKNRIQNKPIKNTVETATVSVFSESAVTPAYSNRRNKTPRHGFKSQVQQTPVQSPAANDNNYSRRFKPKIHPSAAEANEHQTSSLYKFKLNRTPGRWQYKTSPKPRVTIRKQNGAIDEVDKPTQPTPAAEAVAVVQQDQQEALVNNPVAGAAPIADSRSDDVDLDSSSSVNGDVLNDEDTIYNVIENKKLPVETLKVEISTPADFKDTYYEIATIKSPYTFQVGSVKNTRYITVTSTFEKTLDPEPTVSPSLSEPLTENILATTAHIDKEHNLLDSSIATLPPLILSAGVETPPLETLIETFSTTQIMLKTHILPVLYEGNPNATSYTLTQTYLVTRLVTATKTLPPMEAYHFNPSKALKEFNSKLDEAGSELNLELDFGDDNENEDEESVRQVLPDDLDLTKIGSEFDLSEVDKTNIPEAHLRPKKKSNQPKPPPTTEAPTTPPPPTTDPLMQNLSPEQLQQLAFLRLINPGAQVPQVITTSKPLIKLETVFESHVIPIFNGISTSFSTISRPVATVSKTEYEIGTSTLTAQLPLPPQQINPFQQQPQQFQVTTAPIVTQTMVTATNSKILKLTFGAKTAYTTLFSTTVVPTVLTTYVTQSVPYVQQTAAFPGYFPAPYAPFPYVG